MLVHPTPTRCFGHLLGIPSSMFADAGMHASAGPKPRHFSVAWLGMEEFATLRVTAFDSPPGFELDFALAGPANPSNVPTPTPSEVEAAGGWDCPTPPPSPSPAPSLASTPAPLHSYELLAALKLSLLRQAATAFGPAWHKAIWIKWRSSSEDDPQMAVIGCQAEIGPRDGAFAGVEASVMRQQPGIELEDAMGMMLLRAARQADVCELEFMI